MYIDPRHLSPAPEPNLAALHREDYLNEKKASSQKIATLPTAPTVDTRLLHAQITARVGRFLRFV